MLLTYCTNIHPGESWGDTLANLNTHLLDVKRAFSPDRPFPIGLRLSRQAADELTDAEADRFADWCRGHDCFVLTINGFPYGRFHDAPVKEKVYLPDWRDPKRVSYTERLTSLLAKWLPEGVQGSVSTVPIGLKGQVKAEDLPVVKHNLLCVAEHIASLRERHGVKIVLALEPEPGCVLESTDEVVEFFDSLAWPAHLRECVGVCYDCCHQAVQFEAPLGSLRRLRAAGVPIGKMQISNALRVMAAERSVLKNLDEPNYLHQVTVRDDSGQIVRYLDLPEALGSGRTGGEWRIHFHVPVFAEGFGAFKTTRFFLEEILDSGEPLPPLEVETYTWEILPEEWQTSTVTESIIRELAWVRGRLDAAHRRR